MNRAEIEDAFARIKDARDAWRTGLKEFERNTKPYLARLLHEAVAVYMPEEEIAQRSGLSRTQVRILLRVHDLDPWSSKTLLSKKAAKALVENATLMGIDPRNMDLMSPLAYLPMGSSLRAKLEGERVSQVHEIPENLDSPVTPEMVEAFKRAWHEADDRGEVGRRVEAGLAAAMAARA